MKKFLFATLIAVLGVGFVATGAEAKRLGGGSSQGMQRQMPPKAPAQTPPPQQSATPGATTAGAAPAAAAAPKRSWMGPIAGLAAGLGIAALMSHLGMGAGMGNFLMIALLAVAAFFIIRMVMSRMRPAAMGAGANGAGAGALAGGPSLFSSMTSSPARAEPALQTSTATPFNGSATPFSAAAAPLAPVAAAATESRIPAGFDTHGFERIAKLIFIRMQAANDASNLDDLRQFSTPEMFAAFRLDLQDRQGKQQTDVVKLDAEVVDYAEEAGRQIVSVRFHGLLREETGAAAAPFDEVWHLAKPADGSSNQWLIAGIAQAEPA